MESAGALPSCAFLPAPDIEISAAVVLDFSSVLRANVGSPVQASALLLGLVLAAPFAGFVPAPWRGPQSPAAQAAAHSRPQSTSAAQVVQHGGYPELRVDGAPFFVHAAVFFYYRVPRDLWEHSLDRYRELGINTIDLPIPWNWHQPRDGEFDFDGHSNPRRDLRGLLRLVAEKGFHLVARPGPRIGHQWRNGGFPDWLLAPAGSGLADPEDHKDSAARDADAAAKAWLEDSTHKAAARRWLAAVAKELAPYTSSRKVLVPGPPGKRDVSAEKEISGPLLFVQLHDSPAFDPAHPAAPHFWRYLAELRRALEAGGVDALFTVNPLDLREAWPGLSQGAAPGQPAEQPIAMTGQWFLKPPPAKVAEPSPSGQPLTAPEAATLEFIAETLKTQRSFPPALTDFQAGWFAPADDVRPPASAPANTLLSSRLLLSRGLHGLGYSPLQDTLDPAAYATPAANRYFRWDAALDLAGNRQPRAHSVARNGHLLELWGDLLPASHMRADFGLVDPRSALGPAPLLRNDPALIPQTLMKIERVADLAGLAGEFLDPESQPAEQLLRYAVILFPVFDPAGGQFELSEKAQNALADYVERGGTLICFPSLPPGALFQQLSQSASARAASAAKMRFQVWGKDFYSWVKLDASLAENRAQFEAAWATQALRELVEQVGLRPAVKRAASGRTAGDLLVTELVSNEGAGALGAQDGPCDPALRCGQGLLSVTNLSFEETAEEALQILSPRAGPRGSDDDYIPLRVQVPPHESLLLPIHFPLCSAAGPEETCSDEVVAAGAELLRVERDARTLELTFYAPARAAIRLKLASGPRKLEMAEGNLEGEWNPENHLLEVSLPRGPAPGFLRVLRVHLSYTPHVPAKPDPHKRARHDFTAAVLDAVRLPLGDDTALPSFPPLVLLDAERRGKFLFDATNDDDAGREINVRVEGPVRGSARVGLEPGETRQVRVHLAPPHESRALPEAKNASPDDPLRGELQLHSGRTDRNGSIFFVPLGDDSPAHYQFDFDRDAANEWVLENQHLRLILSPASGGRALALVDKTSGVNLTTTVGALGDLFALPGASLAPSREPPQLAAGPHAPGEAARTLDVTWNRAYHAEWTGEKNNIAVRLSYQAPEGILSGAKIEKTVRLAGADAVEVDYRVSRQAPAAASARGPLALVVGTSVSARAASELSTRFCWQAPLAASAPHCEVFVPGSGLLDVPAGVTRLEVSTPGRAGLALEWKAGKLVIEKKNFSALLKLQFPALHPSGGPAEYQLRYTVLPAE